MRIVDEVCIRRIREQAGGRCEACGRDCRYKLTVHHIHSRGAGRVDIPENLIALGDVWDCNCHGKYHAASGVRRELMAITFLTIVAVREKTWPHLITEKVWLIRRSHKYAEITNELPKE